MKESESRRFVGGFRVFSEEVEEGEEERKAHVYTAKL